MAEIRREKKNLAEGAEEAAKIELTEEQLEKINGGGWYRISTISNIRDWMVAFNRPGYMVVWRQPNHADRWCTIERYSYDDFGFYDFDLYYPNDGYVYFGVPAYEVLVEGY